MYITHVDLVKVRSFLIKVRKNEPAELTELNCVPNLIETELNRESTLYMYLHIQCTLYMYAK